MPNWTRADLQRQFRTATTKGWVPAFQGAAHDYAFPVELLMGIASRETNMRNIVGDGGHGYGLMQIDDRSFPDFCHSGQWQNALACIHKGALVLDGKREQIRNGQGLNLKIEGKSFRGQDNLSGPDLTRIAVAAYNSGLWAYYSFSTSGDHNPDLRTTHRDYSADVLQRTVMFRDLLDA
jgi:hypothetical protein